MREEDPACPGCGLSLDKVDGLLGAVPRLVRGLSDGAKLFSRPDSKRILAQLHETHILFPQIEVSVVTLDGIPDRVNLSTYSFWLFNRSDVVRQLDTDGRNYDVLFTIDSSGRRAAAMVGYGLEPLIGKRHLDRVLSAGRVSLVAGDYAAALLQMIEELQALLKEVALATPKAFALPEAPEVRAKTMTEAALDY